jgi:hypothetical protein
MAFAYLLGATVEDLKTCAVIAVATVKVWLLWRRRGARIFVYEAA